MPGGPGWISEARLTRVAVLLLLATFGPGARASDAPEPDCGRRPSDWCAAPAGDPCGVHADEAGCRADARCVGMRYRGESMVSCMPDGKGFWRNCPAVGCVSRGAVAGSGDDGCKAKYGEVVDFAACATVALPDLTVA